VARRHHLGVTGRVDRGDVRTAALHLLGDASRPGEQIQRAARSGDRGDGTEYRHQSSFRTEVLDHVEGRAYAPAHLRPRTPPRTTRPSVLDDAVPDDAAHDWAGKRRCRFSA